MKWLLVHHDDERLGAEWKALFHGCVDYPTGCGKAQQFHLKLNPDEIRLWEAKA